jgi:GH35 family endo-1,4-beta-xylanase
MKQQNKVKLFLSVLVLTFFSCGKEKEVVTPAVTYTLKTANPAVKFGSLVYINSSKTPLDVASYKFLIKREFNVCQTSWFPGFYIGWNGDGDYDFKKFNENVNFLKESNITPWMHLLFGPNFYEPVWLVKGNYSAAKLESLMKAMIDNIMDSNDNKNKIEIWNVVNEVFNQNGSYRQEGTGEWDNIWLKMGMEEDKSGLTGAEKINNSHPVFIRKAFEYCRAKTTKKLEIRDYGIEALFRDNPNAPKHRAMYQLIKHLKAMNTPIDAVGIQGHLYLGQNQSLFSNFDIQQSVKRFKDLGVEVYITEMDVAFKGTMTEAKKLEQKSEYKQYVKQAVTGGVTLINTWGTYDNGEAGNWRVDESPLLWDATFKKKPAYDGVIEALRETVKK